ncbi:putative transcriptional regulator [Methanohalophilus levihalophilus]|uniref:helix-turn-helix transcriptional regulator n=1 Tax=Methanohalophilus levihalophilus TaxID=1431282 RepID=UPI001AE29B6E|nr:winged helix-turn-helix domain-containing protein [Methanohalophilus levihalophilus]MBP2029211.1 putative transcriptional regulator [Methanohalophilus levihalophilus]
MDDCLLDIACRSDKRKGLLLYLLEGPHNLEEIKKALHVTSTGMLPQIKILKDDGFVEQDGDYYQLSILGRIAANKLRSFLDITETLDKNYDYWSTRDISSVPLELQEKLGMLKDCQILSPSLDSLFEIPKQIVELLSSSMEVCAVASHYHPLYVSIFDRHVSKGKKFSCIISEIDIFQEKNQENFKFTVEKSTFYLSEIPMSFSWFIVSNNCLVFALLNSKHEYDGFVLFGESSEAIAWGNEFFDYYVKHSHRIKESDLD